MENPDFFVYSHSYGGHIPMGFNPIVITTTSTESTQSPNSKKPKGTDCAKVTVCNWRLSPLALGAPGNGMDLMKHQVGTSWQPW